MLHKLFKNSHHALGFILAAFFPAGNQLLFQDIWFVLHPGCGTGRVSQPHLPVLPGVLIKKTKYSLIKGLLPYPQLKGIATLCTV